MTGQGNVHEYPEGGAELPEASGDRRASPDALVAAATERAPPPANQAGEQGSPTSSTPVVTTDDVLRLPLVEVGQGEPTLPVQVGRVVLGMTREAPEPFVLPPSGTIPFILGNKHVWRRFMASTVILTIAILVVAVALMIAGIHLDVITVSITSAATAFSIAARAYFGQRRGTKPPLTSTTASDEASSS
jgi:hypothetical protein